MTAPLEYTGETYSNDPIEATYRGGDPMARLDSLQVFAMRTCTSPRIIKRNGRRFRTIVELCALHRLGRAPIPASRHEPPLASIVRVGRF